VTGLAKKEYMVLGILCLIFLAMLFPALQSSRREVRDGIRRNELVQFKVLLEQYFNEYNEYPLEFDASPHEYVVTEVDGDEAMAWYLRAKLENGGEAGSGFDLEHNVFYRVFIDDGLTFYDICGGGSECGFEGKK